MIVLPAETLRKPFFEDGSKKLWIVMTEAKYDEQSRQKVIVVALQT